MTPDRLSDLGLTVISIYLENSHRFIAYIKRPYRKTRQYVNISGSSQARMRRLYDSDNRLMLPFQEQTDNLFYWRKGLTLSEAGFTSQEIKQQGQLDPLT